MLPALDLYPRRGRRGGPPWPPCAAAMQPCRGTLAKLSEGCRSVLTHGPALSQVAAKRMVYALESLDNLIKNEDMRIVGEFSRTASQPWLQLQQGNHPQGLQL